MNSLCTKYISLLSVLIYGFLFLHLSSCQKLSEESLDYVNRNEILENIEILERSNDVESGRYTNFILKKFLMFVDNKLQIFH